MRGKKMEYLKSMFHGEVSGQSFPLIEILHNRRVLIENHICVLDYQAQKIDIKVSYGKVSVGGSGLVISYMTHERLVITGTVDSVTLCQEVG